MASPVSKPCSVEVIVWVPFNDVVLTVIGSASSK